MLLDSSTDEDAAVAVIKKCINEIKHCFIAKILILNDDKAKMSRNTKSG